jgi:hypothetical protein
LVGRDVGRNVGRSAGRFFCQESADVLATLYRSRLKAAILICPEGFDWVEIFS